MPKKNVTPEYTKKAIRKYNDKFDRVAVNLPKGTKNKIKELTGLSCNRYINDLVLEDIKRMEEEKSPGPDPAANKEKHKSFIFEEEFPIL